MKRRIERLETQHREQEQAARSGEPWQCPPGLTCQGTAVQIVERRASEPRPLDSTAPCAPGCPWAGPGRIRIVEIVVPDNLDFKTSDNLEDDE